MLAIAVGQYAVADRAALIKRDDYEGFLTAVFDYRHRSASLATLLLQFVIQ